MAPSLTKMLFRERLENWDWHLWKKEDGGGINEVIAVEIIEKICWYKMGQQEGMKLWVHLHGQTAAIGQSVFPDHDEGWKWMPMMSGVQKPLTWICQQAVRPYVVRLVVQCSCLRHHWCSFPVPIMIWQQCLLNRYSFVVLAHPEKIRGSMDIRNYFFHLDVLNCEIAWTGRSYARKPKLVCS